jgi:nucleotide-binding universal stress UspA family protein
MELLLAVDKSDASIKAVRFVSKMFGGNTRNDVSVTILHVIDSLPDFLVQRCADAEAGSAYREVATEWTASDREAAERMLADQKQVLVDAGIPEASVETQLVVKEARPNTEKVVAALAIIEKMQQGSYAVVCLGRRSTSPVGSVFLGSVAEKVLREAQGKTVWVVD